MYRSRNLLLNTFSSSVMKGILFSFSIFLLDQKYTITKKKKGGNVTKTESYFCEIDKVEFRKQN